MTSVEKRHSGRRSGGHRKHSDGGYSDTSSGGSFLDETDREVSNLTDRAFRSLCIGDEAVYNDSDLCASSPSAQRERQQAFSKSGQDRDKEDSEREELKRAAHESFSLRVQQYGQDWIHGGIYGAETGADPQWGVYGEGRTEGRVSATFQPSFVEMSQQEKSLKEEHLSFLSNGATELSSQQRRSRSRVSSLIKAFNSEGYRDGVGADGKLREWSNETSWDKSALMSIQRELSEFSSAYHQNFNSGPFPSAGPFSSQDNSFYSSEVATAMAHMNSTSSFMRSSHSKHSMSTQVSSNSNFFIHSEFSPFKVWRDHNRFPFQQGEVSGFMPRSEFPKWYETPMYKELSLGAQPQGPSMFDERGVRPQRKTLAPVAPPPPPPPPRSTSTSTMLHKASAVEKRCESELAGHYPNWKRTQSLGSNRLPSQRPSTVSPTIEMSRRVRDTLSSFSGLQQKLTMMTSEQNITMEMTANQQGVLHSSLIPFGNNNTAVTVPQNAVSSNTSTTPFNISQLLTPVIHTHQETETSEVQQYAVSPLTVEHPPVRAESRGATPDVRMSSYKSRATSLLFNLKDNRKRVKSTYSPTKFKGLDIMDKHKQPSNQDVNEPRDTVIDIPDFPDPDVQIPQVIVQEEPSMTDAASHQLLQAHHSPGLPFTALTSQPTTAHIGQNSEYTSSDYLTAQMQGEMVHHTGFSGLIQENYTSNQLANGQNLYEDLSSFTPYKQGQIDKIETLAGDVYRQTNSGVPNTLSMVTSPHPKLNLSPKPSYSTMDTPRLNTDYTNQKREYLISKTKTAQDFSESSGGVFAKVDRYEQVKENKYGYSDVSSQERWRQQLCVSNTSSQDTEMLGLKAPSSPWKGGEIPALTEKDQYAQSFQRAAMIKDEFHSPRDKYGGENKWNISKEQENTELRGSLAVGTSSHPQQAVFHNPYHTLVNPNLSNQLQQYAPLSTDSVLRDAPANGKQQSGTLKDKYELQNYYGHNEEHEMKENYLMQNYLPHRSTEQEYRKQQTFYSNEDIAFTQQETAQRKQYMPLLNENEVPRFQQKEAKQQYDHNMQSNSLSSPDKSSAPTLANQVKDRQYLEVTAEQARAEQIQAEHAQAELAKAQHADLGQVAQPKAESARPELIIAGQTGIEEVKAEQAKTELTEQDRAKQTEVEHVKAEEANIKAEHEQRREKQAERAREEQTKAEQTREQEVKVEQKNKTEKARAEHTRGEQGEKARAEQAEAERIKEEHIKVELAMAERAGRAKAEQAQAEQTRRERIRAEQAEAERIRAEQAEAERLRAEQAEAQRIRAEQAEAERLRAKQAEAERIKAEQAEAERIRAKQAEAQRLRAEQAEAERIKAEQAEAERIRAKQAEAQRLRAEQAEAQRIKAEQAEAERIKAEQAEAERIKAEQAEAQRLRAKQAEAERIKAEQAEAQRLRAKQAEAERIKAEQAEAQRIKAEQAEAERIKAEQAEAQRLRAKQAEAERIKAEQAEAQRLRAEQAEAQRLRAEQAEAERIKAEQAEAQRLRAKQAEAERIKAEQAEAERLRAKQAEAERIKAEQAEAERIRAKQAEAERIRAEQIRAERIKAEQAKLEQAKLEQMKVQQAKAEDKAKLVSAGKVKADHIQIEEVKEKVRADLIQAGQVSAERPRAEIAKAEQAKAEQAKAELAKAEQAKAEQAKAELAKAELAKIEKMKEESAKSKAKLSETEQAKHEPDKVEQVKTELAKAKAELAKIKEKMRGEQKQKVRNTVFTKEDDTTNKDVPAKNEECKEHDQATQMHQQNEDSAVSKNRVKANRGADDYDHVREKYGFSNTISTNRSKPCTAANVSSKDDSQMSALALDKVEETMNNNKSKDESSPISRVATAKTENQEREVSIKYDEVKENQYVYSESSKEFKLSSTNDLPPPVNKRTNSETVIDKAKDDRVMNENSEKCDPLKHNIDVSLQRNSDYAKPIPLERKPKPTEHSVVPGKDTHYTPPRALSYKERAQTKQEILTSKIKAHAEKEISAIKEKGFAIRDGFLPKNTTKSQSNNVRQKPPSLEVSSRHENTISNNITPKQQMGPLGMKMEPVKSLSPPSSATAPVKSSTTTSQLDHSLKQVPKEPLKSNDTLMQPPREPERAESNAKSIDEGSKHRLKKEEQSGIKSTQNKEQTPNSLGKQEANHGENSEKQQEGLKSKTAINTDLLNEKKVDPSQAKAQVKPEGLMVNANKIESSQLETQDKAESKSEAVPEDSAPSLKLVFGQGATTVADDSLQIMGIMVTVRERNPSMNNGQMDEKAQEETQAKEKEHTNTEPIGNIKCHPSSGLDLSKENDSLKDVSVSIVKEKDRVVQEAQPTAKNDKTEVGINNHPENMQEETSNTEPLKCKTQVINEERTIFQEESSSMKENSQSETRLQDPLADKDESPAVIEPAKNKVLAETQPLLFKHGIITRKAKHYTNEKLKENSAMSNVQVDIDDRKPQTQHINEKSVAKAATTNYQENFNRGDTESLMKHDVQPSMKEDMTKSVMNPSKSRNIDGGSAPLQVEKTHDSAPPEVKPHYKDSSPNSLTGNENTYVSITNQHTGKHSGDNSQVDENVHIGCIAIRVVPGETEKDNQNVTGKHTTIKIPTTSVSAVNKNKQVAVPSPEEKMSTSKEEDRAKLLTPASKDSKPIKDSLEARYMSPSVRQGAHSLKVSDQHNSVTPTSENTQLENRKPEKVKTVGATTDETKRQLMEEDYFQLQGVIETNSGQYNDNANVGGMSDAVSERKDIAGLLPDKASISKETHLQGEPKSVRNEAFVLNEGKKRTVESNSASDRNVDLKRINREDKMVSKQSDGPTERQSNKSEKMEVGQAIHIRKHRTSSKERQSTKNLYPTRDHTVKENVDYKPEVKPKPKEKVSTIPEISAIADYARLKVIVSEDRPDTIQDLPPSKKEGFIPRIQTRHSRRPVFTTETQDLSVKQKPLPKETELSSKVNKEPKALVFSTMEKEHKRTGMFKLGEKERQENMLPDVKANEGVTDSGAIHTQDLKESSKPTPAHLKNPGSGEQEVAVAGNQRLSQQGDQSIYRPHNPPTQAPTSLSSINKTRNASLSRHPAQLDNSIQVERPKEELFPPKAEGMPHMDNNSHPQHTLGQMYNLEESRTTQRKDEKIEKQKYNERAAKIEDERMKIQRQERLATQREKEIVAKQREAERKAEEERRAKQLEEKRAKQKAEEIRIKQIKEESRAALVEEERRAAQREEERRAREREAIALKIEERRVKQREVEQRAEEERKAKQLEQERAAREEEERRAKLREEERRMKEIEEEKRAKLREEERRMKEIEEERREKQRDEERAAQEEEQRRAAQIEEKRRAKQREEEKRLALIEEQRKAKRREEERAAQIAEEKRIKEIEEQKKERQRKEEWMAAQREEEERRAAEKEEKRAKQREQQHAKEIEEERTRQLEEERTRQLEEERRAAQKEEEKRVARERMLAQQEEESRAKEREEEKLAAQREEERASLREEQRRAAQRKDALQYYAITSTESERKPRDRHLRSPLPSQRRVDPSGVESTEDSGSYSRPSAPPSPAPALPRSNTSSPALGAKPTMFRVKDNTMRGSSFKSVKPRFHKNFGEDFRVGSPLESWRGSERGEEEQDRMRRSSGTPIHHDTVSGFNRLPTVKESLTPQPASSSQEYSAPLPEYRPFSRRSIALDEDDSRSVISNVSEDVESFATSATDLADLRGLYDYERPESACSFSSDVARSLGKPPTVPPKSEKALRRAQRLTTRRIKKELSKVVVDSPTPVEKPVRAVSSIPSSPTELRSSSRHALASPHFSAPVSLSHAPTLESSVPSSHTEMQSSYRSFRTSSHATAPVSLPVASPHATAPVSLPVASPHATAPVSLPVASPHATAPVSLPVASPHATAPVSLPVTPKTVASVPSSPTLHHTSHPAPVTQYHVESGYAQSFPLTQRKVLQDLGSGQYFVVDMPVQVKTKTFFDPETGKYVQLNVRQSAQSGSRPQSQPAYSQPQLQPQPQMQVKPQQQPHSQVAPAGKPYVLYQGYQGYPQGYQPVPVSSLPPHRSSSGLSVPATLSQDPEPVTESQSCGYQENERGQNSVGQSYSPEQTPYMDTAHDTDKTYNVHTAHNTHGSYESYPEHDTNNQLAGSSVYENENPAHSRLRPRDIISISELEDFMDVSDW